MSKEGLCFICGKNLKNLSHHKLYQHNEESSHPCESCKKQFKSLKDILVHVKQFHGKNIACTMCDKLFASKAYLQKHMKMIHLTESTHSKEYECVHCEKKFKAKHHLKIHETSHCPVKFTSIYKCNICLKSFTKKGNLESHVPEYIEKKQLSLGRTTDQLIEQTH